MHRWLAALAYTAALSLCCSSAAWARVYDRIQKPWSLSSLLELTVITLGVTVLARTRRPRWAVLALASAAIWGVFRVALDPMFDPLLGVMMRRHEVTLAVRMVYLVALFAAAVTPLAAAMTMSAHRGHYMTHRWRSAFVPAYAALSAVLIVGPEFMTLSYLPR